MGEDRGEDWRAENQRQPVNVIITNHAVRRYIERIEKCSTIDARERIKHAMEISRLPTAKQLLQIDNTGQVYRWCEVESLMLICRRKENDTLAVVTLFRIPADSDVRSSELRKRGRSREYLRRKDRGAA